MEIEKVDVIFRIGLVNNGKTITVHILDKQGCCPETIGFETSITKAMDVVNWLSDGDEDLEQRLKTNILLLASKL